jgi:heptosyltransferase-3
MSPRAALFCHNGLGDGVNSLVLSNNLHLNGWKIDTYQNSIGSMQNWFPHLPVLPYPNMEELPDLLSRYDEYFVCNNDTDPFVQKLMREGKKKIPDRMKIIYLYPSPNIVREPYYADCLTDPKASIAENFRLFCRNILHLPRVVQGNGFIPPEGLVHRKYPNRVVIHPTSSRITRNWPKEKFVKLALHLKKEGYSIHFIPGGKKEQEEWEDVKAIDLHVESFATLDLLARYIYESGYHIGNDSGLGHLASALSIPTLTFCRRRAWANMWAPSFHRGIVLTPHPWIPNIRGLRIRDRHWKSCITVGMAQRAFRKLSQHETD